MTSKWISAEKQAENRAKLRKESNEQTKRSYRLTLSPGSNEVTLRPIEDSQLDLGSTNNTSTTGKVLQFKPKKVNS